MTEISLQAYCEEIEGLIERSAYDGAISHCRHILQQHPKYIEAYRLMGKALLEKEDYEQAVGMFARVLSADPADFVARVALAIIYDRQGELSDALWQMERAFELRPGNDVVQSELRKLYARRDGVEPEKIPLTRGALARLYLNGELYSEATAELRAMLAQEPNRPDLQVLLAETLWRYDRRYHYEAQEVAQKVLDRLPYCLDANLLLGEIWQSSEREEDAEIHLKRAQTLDPEGVRAQQLFGPNPPIPAQAVQVERMEYVASTEVAPIQDEVPSWLSGLQLEPEGVTLADVTLPEEGQSSGWLQGMEGEPAEEPAAWGEAAIAATSLSLGEEPLASEVPDWLADMSPQSPESAAGEPDWLAQLHSAASAPSFEAPPAAAEEGVPDWLSGLGGLEEPAAGVPEDQVPDWLGAQPAVQEAESAEMPDWLRGMQPAEAAPVAPAAEEEAVEAELPDWLKAMQPAEAAPVAPAAEEEGEMPDWLKAMQPTEAAPVAPAAEEESELPDWLKAMQPAEVAPVAPAAEEESDLPDWLRGMQPAEAAPVAPAAEEETELPDWLKAMQPAEAAPVTPSAEEEAVEAELPDWLKAMQPAEAAPVAPAAQKAEEELPAWLQETTPTPSADQVVTPAVAEELPPWMTGEGAMPSPEEALAWLSRAAAGKEEQLQAQAAAEAEARMAEIMGRKAEKPAPPAEPPKIEPKVEKPAPTIELPKVEQRVEKPAPAVELPKVEPKVEKPAPPKAAEELPPWMMGEGAMPSPEEALAWLSRAAAGKEEQLQAQAAAEAEARMAEIMGRKAEKPAPPAEPPKVEPKIEKPAPPKPPKVEPKIERPAPPVELPKVEPKVERPALPVEPPKVEPEVELPALLSESELAAELEAELEQIVTPKVETVLPVEAVDILPAWAESEAPFDLFEGLSIPGLAEAPEPAAQQEWVAPVEFDYGGLQPTGAAPGPAWWYQIAADEEEGEEEVEAPTAEVAAPVPVQPQARPEQRAPRPPRPKVTIKPSGPVFDMEGIMARLRANPNDHNALLDLARGWMQQDNMAGASESYEELVKAGALLDQVIDDLEMATDAHPSAAVLWQVLGDAYMKNGQLQKALKTYRHALKKI